MNLDELKVSFSHRTIIRTQDVNKYPRRSQTSQALEQVKVHDQGQTATIVLFAR